MFGFPSELLLDLDHLAYASSSPDLESMRRKNVVGHARKIRDEAHRHACFGIDSLGAARRSRHEELLLDLWAEGTAILVQSSLSQDGLRLNASLPKEQSGEIGTAAAANNLRA